MSAESTVRGLLDTAGIEIGGDQPYDLHVSNPDLYRRVLRHGILGVGEAYMDGWWDAEQPDELLTRALNANVVSRLTITPEFAKTVAVNALFNQQTKARARYNAEYHYNVGNDLYQRMLDPRMLYTCAYWGPDSSGDQATDLAEAQEAKLDLVCRKLHLEPGMSVLDLGCGWGGFSAYAAEKYGVTVTGITPAREQVALATERTADMPDVTILQGDYRDVTSTYDRVVSIGLLEHVGPKNYKAFFAHCANLLKDDGLMLHHFISGNKSTNATNPWTDKYIFPGGVIPTLAQVSKAIERKLIIEDVQNIGPDYDPTLMAWDANFTAHYPEIADKYDERFKRMWRFYLLSSAAGFRSRNLQLHHIVLSKVRPSERYDRELSPWP